MAVMIIEGRQGAGRRLHTGGGAYLLKLARRIALEGEESVRVADCNGTTLAAFCTEEDDGLGGAELFD